MIPAQGVGGRRRRRRRWRAVARLRGEGPPRASRRRRRSRPLHGTRALGPAASAQGRHGGGAARCLLGLATPLERCVERLARGRVSGTGGSEDGAAGGGESRSGVGDEGGGGGGSVSRGRGWSTWPSTGCDESAPKPSYDEAVHSPAEAPAALPFHSAGPPHLGPGAAAPPTTAATEDAYEGTWLEEVAAGRVGG